MRTATLSAGNRTVQPKPSSGARDVTGRPLGGLIPMRPPETKTIRVLLAHEAPLFAEGLRSVLKRDPRFAVVGAAFDGRDLLRQARVFRPTVIVLDVNLPGFRGVGALRSLRRTSSQTQVIVLAHVDAGLARAAARWGARGFLLMNCSPQTFLQTVAAAHAGGAAFASNWEIPSPPEPSKLTAREREVLALVAEGLSSRQAAARLGIGPRTVETYRERLMDKLNARNAGTLIRSAIALGLVKF